MACQDSILGKMDPNACTKIPLTKWDVPFGEKKTGTDSVMNPKAHSLVGDDKPLSGKQVAPKETKQVPEPETTKVAPKKELDLLGELHRLDQFGKFFTTHFATFDTNKDDVIDPQEIDEAAKQASTRQAVLMIGFAKESTIGTEIAQMSKAKWEPAVGFTLDDLRKFQDEIQKYRDLKWRQQKAVPEYYSMVNSVMNNFDSWDVNGDGKLDGAEIKAVYDSADAEQKPMAQRLQFDYTMSLNPKGKSLAEYQSSLRSQYLLSILNKPMGISPFVEYFRESQSELEPSKIRKLEDDFAKFLKKQS